jgi:uncharacterized membrane-anchored protein
MKKLLPILLIVVAALQVGVVGWMIASREIVRAKGREVKFVIQPVDPEDPFHGRYVALRFEAGRYESGTSLDYRDDSPLYATLAVDADGYATVTGASHQKPASGDSILVREWRSDWNQNQMNKGPNHYILTFPFDRYYMNESAAPEAEQAYREANQINRAEADKPLPRDNYLVVRVYKGEAVAEELFIKGQPIEKLLAAKK